MLEKERYCKNYYDLNLTGMFPTRMSRNNGESQTRPQPNLRAQRELEISMASFRKRLEAIRSRSERGNPSQEGET